MRSGHAIDEMGDAEKLIDRILYLDGVPSNGWLETRLELICQVGEAHYFYRQIGDS